MVSRLVVNIWPPTFSFKIFEKWTCSSFFATSSKASFSLRSLFVSRFRMLWTSLICLWSSSKVLSLGESSTFSDLGDDDIFLLRETRQFNDALAWIQLGVTTSRATSGERKKDPNTSGQRWNNINNSYRDRSFVVSGNNRVVKPKCKQFTSLNKMLSNFSKVLIVNISFTTLINNEGIGGIWKVPRRIKCTFCSCRKQSCCKAEMLSSYTSLLKKLSNFPQALTGTILLMLY